MVTDDALMHGKSNQQGLPETLTQILEIVPAEQGNKIIEAYGGTRVRFRSILGPLAELIGRESAEALARYFGDEFVTLPVARNQKMETRNAGIKRDRESGLTVNQIALKYRLTRRTVFRVLRSAAEIE
jgi:Mor family transcriptional regulator